MRYRIVCVFILFFAVSINYLVKVTVLEIKSNVQYFHYKTFNDFKRKLKTF